MPNLAGQTVVDASGNQVLDAASNIVRELDVPLDIRDINGRTVREILELVPGIGDVLEAVGVIQQYLEEAAISEQLAILNESVDDIEADTSSILSYVLDPVFGAEAVKAALDAILAAVGAPQQTGVAVTLPTTPPAGYGGSTPTQLWGATLTPHTIYDDNVPWVAYGILNDILAHDSLIAGQAGYLDSRNPYFALVGESGGMVIGQSRGLWSDPDTPAPASITWSDWTPGTSLVNFLNAQTTGGWSAVSPDGYTTPGVAWLAFTVDTHPYWWRCLVYEWQLPFVSGKWLSMISGAVVPTAPVWPGVANVTMGTPVALAEGVTVTEPMDGVIVSLTSVPAKTGAYYFDEHASYTHLGAVAFVSDDGQIEQGQSFSFGEHLLCPRAMNRAAACYVRCGANIVGTVTPWVRTST